MADEADIASMHMAEAIDAALRQRQQQNNNDPKPSAKFCKECGEEISEARRKLGNIMFCVECANERERRKALFANY